MQLTTSRRAAIGAACLVAVALVMGWFVGRYIPGTPRDPEPPVGDGLYSQTGYVAEKIVDLKPGATLEMRGITMGMAYNGGPEEVARKNPPEVIENWKRMGLWEYDAPDIELSVVEVKVITTKSFADWYPNYRGISNPVYDSGKLVAVTVSLTNTSSDAIELESEFPHRNFSLWGENLDHIDGSLGAGACLDPAYYDTNEIFRSERRIVESGASETLVLPFKVNRNNLKDPGTFDDLDPSAFCLQLIDYRPATAYRLWL